MVGVEYAKGLGGDTTGIGSRHLMAGVETSRPGRMGARVITSCERILPSPKFCSIRGGSVLGAGGGGIDAGRETARRGLGGVGFTFDTPSNISFRLRRRGFDLTAALIDVDESCEGVVLPCPSAVGNNCGWAGAWASAGS